MAYFRDSEQDATPIAGFAKTALATPMPVRGVAIPKLVDFLNR